jgi:hypothetical protein
MFPRLFFLPLFVEQWKMIVQKKLEGVKKKKGQSLIFSRTKKKKVVLVVVEINECASNPLLNDNLKISYELPRGKYRYLGLGIVVEESR